MALRDRGHEVQVLTGFPNYPTGRLADGLQAPTASMTSDATDIDVRRVALYPNHDASPVHRAAQLRVVRRFSRRLRGQSPAWR